jgi:iron(III) transport system substrate-binding protein
MIFTGKLRCAIGGAAIAIACFAASCALAQTGYEAAKQEGRVVWYTTFIVPQAAQPIADAFMKKYPGVDVALTRADSIPTALKILAEGKAGRIRPT